MTETTKCPKCGRKVIEVEDWGKAGKLHIHCYEMVNGLRTKDACHVFVEGPRYTIDGEKLHAAYLERKAAKQQASKKR